MEIATNPEWQRLALYALGAAVVLILVFNLPYIGRAVRALFSMALFALGIFLLMQHAAFDPTLSNLMGRAGLTGQEVVGREVRIRMAPDGHFWARVSLNGVERRMLIDSGATITALSAETARRAGVEMDSGLVPVMLRTANGTVRAETGTVERLTLSGISARNLKVVVSPSLGDVDVLGMNFLSQLGSWRVEGRTLILTPEQRDRAPRGQAPPQPRP